jgi:hypothetical protein
MATRSLRHPEWDAEDEELVAGRIVRFPERTSDVTSDDGPELLDQPARSRRRQARQAARPDSMPRYFVTAGAILLAVLALWYLLIQLGQLGHQSPSPPVAATTVAAPAPAAPVAPPQPTGPAAAPGEGPLRTTSRVLEPSYTVQPGDTLGNIAARFGTSVEALQSINNLADRNVLSVGQKLVIPNQQ